MNRRTFLASTLGLAFTSLMAGCQRLWTGDLVLATLAGSVPGQAVQAFQRQVQASQGRRISVVAKDSLLELYHLLETWHGTTQTQADPATDRATAIRMAHWVTQADTWLAPAIQQGLIQPITTEALDQWDELPDVWPTLVRRNAQGLADDGTGEVWGIPYRWTPLAILYDRRTLGATAKPIRHWADLLRPEWKQRLMLPDDERLVIGLALKALQASANAPDLAAIPGVDGFLTQIHSQVRSYDSTHSLKALIVGDVSALVGWVDALLPIAKRYRHLKLVIPPEGTLASADLWVQPSVLPDSSPLSTEWLNFCLSPPFMEQLAIYGQGLSPWHWGAATADLPPAFQPTTGFFEDTTGLAHIEFLQPLPASVQAQYTDLWQRLRS